MNLRVWLLPVFLLVAAPAQAQSLRGTVTDPSGAVVPNATVQLRGPSGERRARTGQAGEYVFPALPAGTYEIRVTAKGFPGVLRRGLTIERPAVFDARLQLCGEKQVVNVDDEIGRVGVEPESNGGAVVMRAQQLAALSDDPDELALQLQALAGPAPGPNGGEMFIDGFSGGSLPPKSSIREVRINANPFSPEYDRPGFARVEVFTRPGSESFHAQAFTQFNDRLLNSRNPLLTESGRPPYRVRLYGLDLSGPIRKNRVGFTLGAEHRSIGEEALIQATTPEGRISQAVATPQSRTSVTPRLDVAIDPRNALTLRYQELRTTLDNQGVGDFNLASRAYRESDTERLVQITETATLGPRAVNETRFQYARLSTRYAAALDAPAIDVIGAFGSGGAPIGNSRTGTNSGELSNLSTVTRGRHTLKWGGRVRLSLLDDDSRSNFAGTFTYYTLEQYRAAQPSQFSRNAGTSDTRVRQADAGVFVNDDWRLRSRLTLSAGVRYEAQTNLGGPADWAPRLGLAWRAGPKTVLRAGFGSFYDRIASTVTLNRLRYNGVTQQSFLILDPPFSTAPPVLDAAGQPQQVRPVYAAIAAPRLYQGSAGIERQLDRYSRISLTWMGSRGVHLLNTRNVNTPIAGAYPYGDPSLRLLTESAGLSRIQQLVVNANVNRRKLMLFGYYALSYGKDNNEGLPADPYNLRAEWGASSYSDVRHRIVLGTTVPLPGRVGVSPFLAFNSGVPYNITTGLDPLRTGYPSERPDGLPHNSARGPANTNLALRVSRTWKFGRESAAAAPADSHSGGTTRGITLSASSMNALNHPNFAPPNGNLSSPYFGQYRALGGLIVMSHGGAPTTYNRKIDLQLRFTF